MPDRLIYVSSARMPTEKAHGYQIAKMCEAFSAQQTRVTLATAHRSQSNPGLRGKSLFEFYSIPHTFELKVFRWGDPLVFEKFMPRRLFSAVFVLHNVLSALLTGVALRSRSHRNGTLFYTRETAVAFWLTRLGMPMAFEAHTLFGGFQGQLLAAAMRSPAMKKIFVLTRAMRDAYIAMGVPPDKLAVEPDAVDPQSFPFLNDKYAQRAELGLPSGVPIVGYIGRFQTLGEEKGIPELIQAMAKLPSGHKALLLCVGGPLSAVAKYEALMTKCGLMRSSVRFVDHVPASQVGSWIRVCDVVTIPFPGTDYLSRFPSPLKMFEYMASGVPIVASDLPSLCDVLVNERNALLTPAGEPAPLAEALSRVLTSPDLGAYLARNAREDVMQYTWEKRARRIIDACSV